MKCLKCNVNLTGKQTKYCSKKCKSLNYKKVYPNTKEGLEILTKLLTLTEVDGYSPFMGGLIDNNIKGLENISWHVSDKGYIRSSIKYGTVSLHRVILNLHNITLTNDKHVDHINRNKLDNRLANLRLVTPTQNVTNRSVAKTKKASIYKGVHQTASGKWQAMIWYNGKNHGLGSYETPEEAALTYDNKAIEIYGEYSCVNFTR